MYEPLFSMYELVFLMHKVFKSPTCKTVPVEQDTISTNSGAPITYAINGSIFWLGNCVASSLII
jgi:hypothetical protein